MKLEAILFALLAFAAALIAGPGQALAITPGGSSGSDSDPVPASPARPVQTLPDGGDFLHAQMMSWSHDQPPPRPYHNETAVTQPRARLVISSPFGWRVHPIQGASRHHDGIDLPGRSGSPIFATGAGVVRVAGPAKGYGNFIEIGHSGGVVTRYGHLLRIAVVLGEAVIQGQRIGEMGSTGHSTGPHLHYEVRIDGAPVNPLRFMGQTAPDDQVAWSRQASVVSKWAGWAERATATMLPQAEIR